MYWRGTLSTRHVHSTSITDKAEGSDPASQRSAPGVESTDVRRRRKVPFCAHTSSRFPFEYLAPSWPDSCQYSGPPGENLSGFRRRSSRKLLGEPIPGRLHLCQLGRRHLSPSGHTTARIDRFVRLRNIHMCLVIRSAHHEPQSLFPIAIRNRGRDTKKNVRA